MEKRGNWWREAKFGMFIHWGLYALLAGSYGGRESGGNAEWIMHDLHIPPEEYRTLAGRPLRTSATRWTASMCGSPMCR